MRKTSVDKIVVNVIPVSRKGRKPSAKADGKNTQRINKRVCQNGHCENGSRNTFYQRRQHRRISFNTFKRHCKSECADKKGARISHKNPCRTKIEYQESAERSGQDKGEQ